MTGEKPQKISIGFTGGQSLVVRVGPEELGKLRDALGSGGWHEVAAEDGTVVVNLQSVLYVLVDTDEPRVGFGL